LVAEVRDLLAVCRRRRALLIVNDRLDVALAARADGCHLGEADLPWEEARRLAPPPFILGFSAASEDACRAAVAAGADYIGAGPAYVTGTKPDAGAPLTLGQIGALGRICHAGGRPTPLVAIGGVAPGLAAPLIRAGADAVAVISAVMGAADPGEIARRLILEVAAARRERTS
jgi:thiamine-phosphate pyrophosphorylase